MSKSRIFPDWDEIKSLRTPLTEGEKALAEYLDKHLPEKWEIYIQPYLNGDFPDIVILKPDVGMGFYEVKDWNPNYYHMNQDEIFVRDSRGEHRIPSPHKQVLRYRDNLIGLYLPNIGEQVNKNLRTLAAFRTSLYFHKMSTEQAKELKPKKEKYVEYFGNDYLSKENLSKIVPDKDRDNSFYFNNDWVEDIRFWLKPPFHSYEEGKSIKLTQEQERHVDPSPKQHQRLRGVAGSGKTLVVAHRAAKLASQGKKVLIVTYNITLWHYIKDMVSKVRDNFSWEKIEFTHFHGFIKNYFSENEISWPDNLDTAPDLVREKMRSGENANNRKYDAILVDEGQDFEKDWYYALCEFLTINDEFLFVTDARQNIYLRDQNWINNMTDTKFRGRWRELNNSYRLPVPVIEKANRFAEMFLKEQDPQPIPADYQLSFSEIEPHLVWQNVDNFDECIDKASKIYKYLTREKEIHPQNIVYLVPTHGEGWKLTNSFKKKLNIDINHVFEDENKNHYHKKAFWMKDGRLKMCTIHSFKGWELRNVILIPPEEEDYLNGSLDNLIYTAITRAQENLIVLNRNSKYVEYGETWDNVWKE